MRWFRKPMPFWANRFDSCTLRLWRTDLQETGLHKIQKIVKEIKSNPTLRDYQEYVKEMIVERGFEDTTVPELFMYLSEEIGEMAKAARQVTKMHTDDSSEQKELGHEMADVFCYLVDLANHMGVDLEVAFREKEEINNRRVWNKKGE